MQKFPAPFLLKIRVWMYRQKQILCWKLLNTPNKNEFEINPKKKKIGKILGQNNLRALAYL